MKYDDDELEGQIAYDRTRYQPSPSPSPPRRRPIPAPSVVPPTTVASTSTDRKGGEEKTTPGAAQPKEQVSQVPLGHLLIMVAEESSPEPQLRDPWSQPLLETPPEELEDSLGAYVDMDDFFTKSHEELYEVYLNLTLT